jgi:integrase
LRSYLDRYAIDRGLSRGAAVVMRAGISHLEQWLARPATLADLEADVLNHWLADSVDAGLSRYTIHSYRRYLVTLRRAAADGSPQGRVRSVKRPRLIPRAWSPDELRRLLAACAGLVGGMARDQQTPRALFWRAFVLVAYHSGLRLGDLMALRHADLDDSGSFVIVQHKTGDILTGSLDPQALEAIAEIATGGRRVFGDLICRRNAQEYFAKIVDLAGLHGSIKRLRATGATAVEAEHPGAAMGFLGHRTPGLAYVHYVDPRLVQAHKPRPPAIG